MDGDSALQHGLAAAAATAAVTQQQQQRGNPSSNPPSIVFKAFFEIFLRFC